MIRKTILASALVMGIVAGMPVHASVIYTSRTSTVSGSACQLASPCVTQSQTSTDLAPFSATLSVPVHEFSNYSVSQQSTLTPNQISVDMSAYQSGYDSVFSSFELDFTVDQPTRF